MSWKSFACVAALSAMAAPVAAAPSLQWASTGSTATLEVVVDATGSLAAEILIDAGAGLTNSNPVIANPPWDTAYPGDNPITGPITNGLYTTAIGAGDLFLSFGSDVVSAGTYSLLTLDFTGSGDITASGLVAQLGALNDGLSAMTTLGNAGNVADFNGDGKVDLVDLDILGQNFGAGPGATMGQGDANGDGFVDLVDLDLLGQNFGFGTATATPEPAAAAMLLLGGLGLVARRR